MPIDASSFVCASTQAIAIHPYYVAVNLVAVARRFVPQWNDLLETIHGRAMQATWFQFLSTPERFTVAHLDQVLVVGAAKVEGRIRELMKR